MYRAPIIIIYLSHQDREPGFLGHGFKHACIGAIDQPLVGIKWAFSSCLPTLGIHIYTNMLHDGGSVFNSKPCERLFFRQLVRKYYDPVDNSHEILIMM